MLELSAEIAARLARGERFALATVTAVDGSAPRDPGSSMLVDADGRVTGSVSGGCVEGAVYELCERVLSGASAVEHGRFGIDDESAFAVGLSCGGEIDVFVQPAGPGLLDPGPFERVLAGASSGVATVVSGPEVLLGRVVVPACGHATPGGTWRGRRRIPRRIRPCAPPRRRARRRGRSRRHGAAHRGRARPPHPLG